MVVAIAQAQQIPNPVTPGVKGDLPTIPPEPQDDGSAVPLLTLNRVYDWPFDSNSHCIYVKFSVYEPTEIEADYYILQVLSDGQWKDYLLDDEPCHIVTYSNAIQIKSDYQALRLRIVGGSFDGQYSNAVTIQYPTIPTTYGYYWSNGDCVVGTPLSAPFVEEVTAYTTDEGIRLINPEQYLRYKWYRRNPHNYALTLIEGATESVYTPTPNDVGYYIVGEVTGDGEHLDLAAYMTTQEIITLPIYCSTEYVGHDGIILNMEYILPDVSQLQLYYEEWADGYSTTFVPLKSITSDYPGQYNLRCSLPLDRDLSLRLSYGGNSKMGFYSRYTTHQDYVMIRPFRINLEGAQWMITAQAVGAPASAEVEVLSINLDGELEVISTFSVNEDTVSTYLPAGSCYLRAKPSADFLQTYFPASAYWSGALAIYPDSYDHTTDVFCIKLQPVPVPTMGEGLIEGTVKHLQTEEARALLWLSDEQDSQLDITMLLINDASEIIATALLNDTGYYKFEDVPLGTYNVIPDAAGYDLTNVYRVTIDEEKPTISNVNFSVKDRVISPIWPVVGIEQLNATRVNAPLHDLFGRPVHQVKPGTILLQGSRKVIIR